jgi:hypothetical protein
MPEFNKSRGFRMSGYSYPGEGPLKGKKKDAQILAARESQATAKEATDKLGEQKVKSTDIMSQKSEIGSGLPMLGELGKELATMAVQEGVGLGVKAATGGFKKEKGKRKTANASGLSGINFGK